MPSYVSRAADKLASVAPALKLNFKDKIVLDVGSSTGGFSDFALSRGAAKIYAVDIGTGQLATKLRSDPRVISMEKTDIRKVTQLPGPIGLALVDVSFISIRQVLPKIAALSSPRGQILAMVKPQFEAKAEQLNRGIIKNDTIRRQILKDFETWSKEDFNIVDKADSKVAGAKGNFERFYLLKPIKR